MTQIELIAELNFYLALGGLVLVFATVYVLFDLYTKQDLRQYIQRFGLLAAFLLTLGGVVMTLLYSEVFGFIPCGLCWLQRIFLYPQAVLTGTALWMRDKTAAAYGIALSIPGLLVGLYQHYLQMGGTELVGCPAAGEGADCTERILFEFGFMTFPLLSTIMFAFLIALYWYIWKTR